VHDHHDHGPFDEETFGFHQSKRRWLVCLWPTEPGRSWLTSVADDADDAEEAILQVLENFAVKSPFRAWAVPMTERNAAIVHADVRFDIDMPEIRS
jgi:hypothetical protein